MFRWLGEKMIFKYFNVKMWEIDKSGLERDSDKSKMYSVEVIR